MKITDFSNGKCEAMKESMEFVNDWVKTNGLPCLLCDKYRTKCSYYKFLLEKGALTPELENN